MKTIVETIKINGKTYPLNVDSNGYVNLELTGEELDTLTLNTEELCDYGIELSNIQINEGSVREDFVPPVSPNVTPATGVYKDIADLRITMASADDSLRNEIVMTNDSLANRITELDENGTQKLQQTIIDVNGLRQDISRAQETANGATEAIHTLESTVDGLRSRISETSQGVNGTTEQRLSQLEQTIDGLRSDLARISQSDDGTVEVDLSSVNQEIDRINQRLSQLSQDNDGNVDAKLSEFEQTIDNLRSSVQSTHQSLDSIESTASEALQTANSLQTKLTNLQESVDGGSSLSESLVEQTADELRAQIKNVQSTANGNSESLAALSSTVDGLKSSLQSVTEDVDGTVDAKLSTVTQSLDSLRSEISEAQSTADGANKQASEAVQTAQGLRTTVNDLQRQTESRITQLSDLIESKVTSDDVESIVRQSADNIKLEVKNSIRTGKYQDNYFWDTLEASQDFTWRDSGNNKKVAQRNGITADVAFQAEQIGAKYARIDGIVYQVTRIAKDEPSISLDSTFLKLPEGKHTIEFAKTKSDFPSPGNLPGDVITSAINLDEDGVKISGKKINITGDTFIENGVIKNAAIESLSADKLTAGTIDANKIRVINLDANGISGLEARIANMKTAIIEPLNSGSMRWDVDNNEIQFFDQASIEFTGNGNALWRDAVGTNGKIETSFLKFNSANRQSDVVLGTQREGHSFNADNNMFTGIRIFPHDDTISTISDYINITDGLENKGVGWRIDTRTTRIFPLNGNTGQLGQPGNPINDIFLGKIHANSSGGGYLQFRRYTDDSISITNAYNQGQHEGINFGSRGHVSYDYRNTMYSIKELFNNSGYAFSDARMKENIVENDLDALEKINDLRLYSFDFKDKTDNPLEPHGHRELGFIAQQAQTVVEDFTVKPLETDGKLSMNFNALLAYSIRAIQQLSDKVIELERKLDEAKTR